MNRRLPGPESDSPQASPASEFFGQLALLKQTELASALLSVIDKLSRGTILIDGRGRVYALNAAARSMAVAGEAFRFAKGRLCLTSTDQQYRLEAFLAAADCEQVLALKVERRPHGLPHRILVSSLPPREGGSPLRHLFAVFVYQSGSGHQIPTEPPRVFRRLYALIGYRLRRIRGGS